MMRARLWLHWSELVGSTQLSEKLPSSQGKFRPFWPVLSWSWSYSHNHEWEVDLWPINEIESLKLMLMYELDGDNSVNILFLPLDKMKTWNCTFVGSYRSLQPKDACFSEDGSLLAVAFCQIITIWDPDTNELKRTFCQGTPREPIL